MELSELKVIELKQGVFAANEINADKVRCDSKLAKRIMINIMSSPGSGKTTTLVRTINSIEPEIHVGVMECDIDASVDAETIAKSTPAKSIQLHTGGMCHMDAQMTQQGLVEMGTDGIDLIFIENVGNLVCPAEFDTGADYNVTILSVPEGDDKPAKYPLVYEVSDVVLINKIDAIEVFDFNKDLVVDRIHELNPKAEIFFISSKTGVGYEKWIDWIRSKVKKAKGI